MASSKMKQKVLQALYKPGKNKNPGITKALTEMEKALESGVKALKGKKDKDE